MFGNILCYCRPLPLITVFDVTLQNTLLISISFDLYSSNKTEILMKLFISFVYTNLYSRINCINHYAIIFLLIKIMFKTMS